MWEKLKSLVRNDTYFFVVLIILVGVGSFGLGRLSVPDVPGQNQPQPPLKQLESLKVQETPESNTKVPVVVSKSGTKYHLFQCPGALQMKPENRIEFEDVSAAEAAGYTPAANCPGI